MHYPYLISADSFTFTGIIVAIVVLALIGFTAKGSI